ncbi:putative bifunctional diguanylate cyclase/phosphodiesterase [Pseudohalioglobus lutimaris]|uniref:GGDEF domain-containing protein n=1 Tax=Pseudohalioglobus lutimaris TaxID=1737061 RepID=A0A2N5X8F9_9GAMM|nr:GGDEF domain-containing phosphodiesterase [Pseudohalioglobus lutimaris]PLW70783.1 hypothetical protein C0039_01230 [Pseudohalioglobus lutimaris]
MSPSEEADLQLDTQRTRFRKTIALAIAACPPERSVAVVVVKMHDIHKLNQVHGYDRVDRTIKSVQDALRQSLKRGSGVCRLSSAIVGLVFEDLRFPHLVRIGLERIQEILAEPIGTEDGEDDIHLHTSVAASLYPSDSESADVLLLNAECALRSTRPIMRPLLLYTDMQQEAQTDTYLLEADLRAALAAKELSVQYQPKVSFTNGSSAGFEALVRWNHPHRGQIPPELFVAIAESAGLIGEMTEWVIQTALRETSNFKGCESPGVSVNVSATMLFDPCFPFVIDSAISMWNDDYSRLTLEITESLLMENFEGAFSLLSDLRQKGITISIDDFGTGYSSLAYFKRLPVDEVKIDRSFITNMTQSVEDQRLVEAIIDLSHKFDLQVVAEGIEDEQTYDTLRAMGCDVAQGYYISKPVDAEGLPLWTSEPLESQYN